MGTLIGWIIGGFLGGLFRLVHFLFVPRVVDPSLKHGGLGVLGVLRSVAAFVVIFWFAVVGAWAGVDAAVDDAGAAAVEAFRGIPTVAAVVTACALLLVVAARPGHRLAILSRAWIPPVTFACWIALLLGLGFGLDRLFRVVYDLLNGEIDPLVRVVVFIVGIGACLLVIAGAGITAATGTFFGMRHMFRASQVHPALPALCTLVLSLVALVGQVRAWTGGTLGAESGTPVALLLAGSVAGLVLAGAELVWLLTLRGVDLRSSYRWVAAQDDVAALPPQPYPPQQPYPPHGR